MRAGRSARAAPRRTARATAQLSSPAIPPASRSLLIRLKQLLETDDGEAADFIIDAKPRLAGVLTPAEIKTLSRSRRQFRFRCGAQLPFGHRLALSAQPRGQMMSSPDRKLVLIVDDTPTNVAVVSGVLKDSYPDESRHQRREGVGHRHRGREAGSHPARRDDARHGRLRGLPELKDIPATRDIPDHLPHRQDRGGRRGEGIRRRRRRLHPQAFLGADRARPGEDPARSPGGADRGPGVARPGRHAAARAAAEKGRRRDQEHRHA